MSRFEDFVQISDDENVSENKPSGTQSLDKRKQKNGYTRRKTRKVIDTIVIDDENLTQENNKDLENSVIDINDADCIENLSQANNVIEINDADCIENLSQRSNDLVNNKVIEINDADCIPNNNTKTHTIAVYQQLLLKENKVLADVIEKCLDLEYSEGMLRIIKRNLMRVYADANVNYKKSVEFQKVLERTMCSLEMEPDRKFSHLKFLCDTLKLQRPAKKRAKLITLATNLKDNASNPKLKRKHGNLADKPSKRPRKDVVIDLDCDEKLDTVINLDEYQTDVIVLDELIEIDNNKENKHVDNEELEHIGNEGETAKATETNRDHILEEVETDVISNTNIINIENSEEDRFLQAQEELPYAPSTDASVPSTSTVKENRVVPITFEPDALTIDMQKIKAIEDRIQYCKKCIAILDETEVCDDSLASPYIKSEKFKAEIVTLYKELCVITGQRAVKRREVRLQVREGHLSGPVRLLEEFLNDNIGSDGAPPFPDFNDVVQCVNEANETQGLGWSRNQIISEASALFVQCGRALQKQRQRREWRDLVSTVNLEAMDTDPADQDPQLLAKLEDNRRLALRKETELIERYATLQETRVPRIKPPVSTQEHTNQTQINHHASYTPNNGSETNNRTDMTYIEPENNVNIQTENHDALLQDHFARTIDLHTHVSKPMNHFVSNLNGIVNSMLTSNNVGTNYKNIVDSNPHSKVPEFNSTSHKDSKVQDIKPKENIVDSNLNSNVPELNSKCHEDFNVQYIKHEKNIVDSKPHSNVPELNSKSNKDLNVQDIKHEKNIVDSKLNSNVSELNSKSHDDSKIQNIKPKENIVDSNPHSKVPELNSKSHEDLNVQDIKHEKNIVDSNPHSNVPELNSISHEDSIVQDIKPEVSVKEDPADIVALLKQLGDNYTSCILDIEDPFLVIDISSDSSDED